MAENIVQVWVERSTDYADTAALQALLSEDELGRARQFVRAQDAKDFIVAHALKRRCIAEQLGMDDPRELQFGKESTGKPYLLDAHIHFNLSHSHGVSALAISAATECGVDIEIHRPLNQLSMLIQNTMTSLEQAWIEAAQSRLKSFMDRWVMKEAFLKLSGLGLSVPLASICTVSETNRVQSGYGVLRGASLFLERNKDYSLAASGTDVVRFDVVETRHASLLSA